MKNIIFLGIWSATVFAACQSGEEENSASTPGTTNIAPAISAIPPDSQKKAIVPAPIQVTTPPPVSMAAATPKMNPAHGQPGHRCDIAVGAPLTGSGTSIAAPPTAQAGPAIQTQTIVPPPPPPARNTTPVTGTGKAVNPAHGQPGHRCDIAVGAPLN